MSPSHRSVREWSRKASTTRQYSKQRALLDKLVATAKNNRFKVFLDWAEAPGKNVPGIVPESSADVGKARLAQHIYASLPMSTESRNAILDRPHPGGFIWEAWSRPAQRLDLAPVNASLNTTSHVIYLPKAKR